LNADSAATDAVDDATGADGTLPAELSAKQVEAPPVTNVKVVLTRIDPKSRRRKDITDYVTDFPFAPTRTEEELRVRTKVIIRTQTLLQGENYEQIKLIQKPPEVVLSEGKSDEAAEAAAKNADLSHITYHAQSLMNARYDEQGNVVEGAAPGTYSQAAGQGHGHGHAHGHVHHSKSAPGSPRNKHASASGAAHGAAHGAGGHPTGHAHPAHAGHGEATAHGAHAPTAHGGEHGKPMSAASADEKTLAPVVHNHNRHNLTIITGAQVRCPHFYSCACQYHALFARKYKIISRFPTRE
jgi:hypothetical protein